MIDKKLLNQIDELKDKDVWEMFAYLKNLLRQRGLVRTSNITGERGEFLAIETYNNTPGLPNLQAAPEGTQNVDALSRNGERYSIKTITKPGTLTGVFYGLGSPEDKKPPEKKFEYVVVVILDKDLNLQRILELNWGQFWQFKKWHKTMRAWNINVTKKLLEEASIIFTK